MLEWSILAGCKSGYQPTSGETERSAPEKRWIRRVSKVSKHLGTRSVVKSVDQRPSANISEKRRPSGRFIKWRTADCIANFVPIPRRRTPVSFGEVLVIAHTSGPWRATAVNSRSSSEGKEQTKSKTSGSWMARQEKERDRRVGDNPCSGRRTPRTPMLQVALIFMCSRFRKAQTQVCRLEPLAVKFWRSEIERLRV